MSETPLIEQPKFFGTGPAHGIGTAQVSGDIYAPTITTAGSRATGKGDHTDAAVRRREELGQRRPHRAALNRCRLLVEAARQDLSGAIEEDDVILRSNLINAVRQTLAQLWSMRKQREEPFGDVINDLQTYLDETPDEDLPNERLIVLNNALERFANEQVVDDHVAVDLTVLLLRGGVNVFQDLNG